MTGYEETYTEHLRIAILRLLAGEGDYTANDSILRDALEHVSFKISRDRMCTELGWLAEQQLVTTREVDELTIAEITKRGLDVAEGRARVPGIKRPSPRG